MVETKSIAERSRHLIEASTLTRLLVVSFFIALSLGLVEGVDVKLLATPFLPEELALWVMRGLMLCLSLMILVGFYRRPAALILALIVFWPAYISLFAGGDVSAFWRDLALIGGLIMSASNSVKSGESSQKEVEVPQSVDVVPFKPEPQMAEPLGDDEAYREDLDLARSV